MFNFNQFLIMKKVMLSAAALLLCAVGYAQVSGAPTAGTAAPLPGAGVGANTGLSIQNGDANKVRVRQAGSEQSVLTYQDNGSGLGGNLARVMQTGDVTGASGYQNAAEVNQSGTFNQSTTVQEGDLNNAIINQGQNDDSSAGNKARIQQGTGQQAESNYAAIEQDGIDNQASTLQTYDNSDAWTRQIGIENKSMIVQNAGPNGTDGHEALVKQNGDLNESSIDQSGEGGRNLAINRQYGNSNQSKQLQTTTAAAGMVGNRGVVYQGRDAEADIDNSEIPVLVDFANNLPDPFLGPTARPFSNNAVAFQTQNGKQQEAEILQFGGSDIGRNYAEQNQLWGWGNDAGIVQHHQGGEGDNYARQDQGGDNNLAGMLQSGTGNKGWQTQFGHRNTAYATQQGDNNLLNMHQLGNDNAATVAQRGVGNRALIVQRDGQSYSARQNLDGNGGGGNQIDALQLGPNGNFGTDGIHCDFNDPMDPTMDYTVPGFELQDICPDC